MLQPLENASREPVPTRAASDLRIVRPDNPCLALGLALSHLMTKPASFALRFGHKAMTGKQAACFKRHYPDGSTRVSRLAVNKFVDQHIERGG
jgi:hypothetical protein